MKESYMEGVANRHGPRSCAPRGNVWGEVSLTVGERVSWVSSSESINPGLPVFLLDMAGKMSRPHYREGSGEPAES